MFKFDDFDLQVSYEEFEDGGQPTEELAEGEYEVWE